jgi:lipopolysaccharide/colanic/teichoic acid biosynthesis glycosyltransferase
MEAKPGITGLWQVEGRSLVPYEDMIRMDIRYRQSLSLLNDLKLMLGTLRAVFSRSGAY